MTSFLCALSFVAGAIVVALIVRCNPKRSIAWLDKVVAKIKAKAEAKLAKARD